MKPFWRACSTILFAVLCFLPSARALAQRRVIIDTDPGVDDAMAILLALNSPELKIEALTVVPGNVDSAQGLENALKLAVASRAVRPACRARSSASAQSEVDHRAVLAWQEWIGWC